MSRWVFIHPPRTGGTSIRRQIGWGAAPQEKHAHYSWLAGQVDMKDTYTFATIRDPYERAVSLWGMWGVHRWKGKPFADWLRKLLDGHPDCFTAPPNDRFRFSVDGVRYTHIAPQMHWLNGPVDYLVRFENRKAGLAEVSERIGQKIDPAVKSVVQGGQGAEKPYTKYLTDEARGMIRELYAADFAGLGYGD